MLSLGQTTAHALRGPVSKGKPAARHPQGAGSDVCIGDRRDFRMTEEMSIIGSEAYNAAKEILEAACLVEGDLFVVGCSTSEVAGAGIGTFSSPELAEVVFGSIYQATQETGVYLAAQCCEHLNRALILEKEAAARYGYEIVSVIPQPKAGGAFATAAYKTFEEPVAVEHIRARAGMDIGDTLIGMHLKDVAVPVRIRTREIGDARVVCARTRPKLIGGARAVYWSSCSSSPPVLVSAIIYFPSLVRCNCLSICIFRSFISTSDSVRPQNSEILMPVLNNIYIPS